MNYFIILLIIILVVIYIRELNMKETFVSGYINIFDYENVDYNTKKQYCNELAYNKQECVVDTVVPSNKVVCNESLIPIRNNELDYDKKNDKNNPTLSLKYDFDLLSSFNNSQIDRDEYNNISELESFDNLIDVKSQNSLENELMSNY
jgi:hypothetical protein